MKSLRHQVRDSNPLNREKDPLSTILFITVEVFTITVAGEKH